MMTAATILKTLGVNEALFTHGDLPSYSPINGELLAAVKPHSLDEIDNTIVQANQAFQQWRSVPAPLRGELVRLFGNRLREHKSLLGELVSLECGKILQEGLGEVQEMIDICDFAVGLSRQLYGLTIASERPGHTMRELWHPIGPIGVISAFNFPVAVWAWNTALALVCGNSVIWKPSDKTPLCALACQAILEQSLREYGAAPEYLSQVILGRAEAGKQLVGDKRVPVISATGSCAMGRAVGQQVAARFGRSILELGGNNGLIVCPSADLELAICATVFGAVGTAGQRCTSTRRLFLHEQIYSEFVEKLKQAYGSVPVGNPLDEKSLVGPLIDKSAYDAMQQAITEARDNGGYVFGGGRVVEQGELANESPNAYYVKPCLIEMPDAPSTVQQETFAPILYVYKFKNLDTAIRLHNDVPQGLSSAIFTNDVREAELFASSLGSDCGIANVNIGTSGAEIGGAFGGEKETGGGRESGSDAWKAYMRRMTTTVNYSRDLPLAQGIRFDF